MDSEPKHYQRAIPAPVCLFIFLVDGGGGDGGDCGFCLSFFLSFFPSLFLSFFLAFSLSFAIVCSGLRLLLYISGGAECFYFCVVCFVFCF